MHGKSLSVSNIPLTMIERLHKDTEMSEELAEVGTAAWLAKQTLMLTLGVRR